MAGLGSEEICCFLGELKSFCSPLRTKVPVCDTCKGRYMEKEVHEGLQGQKKENKEMIHDFNDMYKLKKITDIPIR